MLNPRDPDAPKYVDTVCTARWPGVACPESRARKIERERERASE